MTGKPENPPAMTRGTRKALARICAANGGGIYTNTISPSIVRALKKRGYIQAKSSSIFDIKLVHTRAGWEANRAMLLEREKRDAE